MGCSVSRACCEKPVPDSEQDQLGEPGSASIAGESRTKRPGKRRRKKRERKEAAGKGKSEINDGINPHAFRSRTFHRPRRCAVCRQLVAPRGCLCRVCKLACHKECAAKVEPSCTEIVSCELPASYLPTVQHAMLPNVPSPASPTPLTNGNNSTPRHTKCGVMEEQPEPDLTYVTERILAVLLPQHSHNYATTRTETNTTSPSITNNSISHRQMAELASMLRSKHGNNYLVLNLSGSQQESEKLHPQVQEYAWPAQHAPPLDVLCSVCKAMDSWLHSDPKHITVIQTKGSKGQLGVVIAAYMYYNSICACADQALDRYAMHRFYDDQVAAESQPSQRRYVGYFSQLLSGRVKVNSQPLFLHGLLLHQLPSLSPAGGCRPFIKIYQALQLIYTSEVFEVPPEMDLLCINIVPGLPLKGDIMVVCYHMLEQGRKREAVFRMQFHTCVVQNFSPLVLRKAELDNACTDARFPDEGSLELIFSPDPDTPPDTKLFGNNSGIRVNNRKSDPIVRWDSYLDFSTTEMQSTSGLGHTEGPVDGSLYARVRKKGSTDSGTATSNGFSPPGCQAEGLESTTPNPVVHSVSNEQGNLEQAHNCSMSFDSGHSTTSAQTDSLMPSRAMHLVPAQVHANGTCPPRETAILNDEEEEEDRKLGIGMKYESESERGVPIPAVPIWSEPFQPSGCSDVRTGPFQEKSCETGSTFGLESAISSKVEMQAGKMSPQLAASVSTDPHLVSRISSNSTLRNDRTHSPFGVNNARTVNGIVNLSIPENVMASSPKYPSDWQRLDRAPQEWNQDTPQQAEFGPVCGPIESQIAGVRTAAVPSIPARTASSRQAVQRTLSGLNGRSRPLARRQQSDTTFDRERPGLCNYDLEEAMLPRLRAEEDFERSLQELNRLILELNHKVVPFGSPGSRPNCSIIHEQHQQLHSPVENNSVVPIDLAQPFVQHLSPQSMTNCVSPKTFSPHTPCLDLNMDMSPSDRRYYYLNGGRATQNENVLPNQVKTCLNPVEESIIYSSPTSLVHVRENRTPLSSRPIGLLGSDMFPMNSASVVPVSHSNSHMQEGGAAPVCNNSTIQSSDTGKQGLRRTDHEDIARLHDVERSPMKSSSPAQDVTNSENVSPTNSLLYGTSSTPAFPVCPPTPYINQGRFTPSPLRGATLSALHLHSPPRTAYSRDIAPVPEAWTPNGTYPCHSEGLSDPSACGQSSPSQGSPTERVSGLDHIQLSASPSLPSHTYRLPTHQWIGQDSSHIPTAFHAEPHEQSSYGFLNGTPRWASSTTVEALGRASHTASTSSADIYRHPSLTSLPNESTMESRARVKFVQDTTKYWYKKDISRDQAVTLLKDKEPGAFVIRDSHSYRGAYGLAVKVSEPPPGLEQPRKDGMLGELGSELVRHYLIESTSKGVRLKGCINEPTFGSLSALVYQHSITPLALPCRLVIPCQDPTEGVDVDSAENHTSEILKQGAACNVLYLGTVELESLTGPEALGRAIRLTLENPPSEPTVVHFKAAAQGITLTDHQRKVFFRRYYKASSITFCDVDPQLRKWPIDEGNCASIFGFVARKQGSHGDNQCHVFAELERDQPAAAITGFVCKALLNAEPIS